MGTWGGMTPEDIEACKLAPAGGAVKIIRQYDPAWGYGGEKFVFEVTVVRRVTETHEHKAKIAAATQEQADILAKELERKLSSADFDYVDEDYEQYVDNVEKL